MPSTFTRKFTRAVVGSTVLSALVVISACSTDVTSTGSPIAPGDHSLYQSGPESGALAKPIMARALLRTQPLSAPVTVTKTISNKGDYIDVPGTDLRLEIPSGAFKASKMTFTVTALAGNAVAYDFQPHGSVFLKPLTFVQKLGKTTLKDVKPTTSAVVLNGAYFARPDAIDPTTGVAAISELLSVDLGFMWSKDEISFKIWHFSGYMICTGHDGDGDGGQ